VRRLLFWLAVAVVLVPAVPLTLNRLVDSGAGPAVRLMAFTPFATPFYALAGLLLVGALVLDRAGPRRVVAVPTVVVVAALALHAWWLAPLFVGGNPAPAAGATPLVVMNLNMYEGGADTDELLAAVDAHDVDVLVLEEISFGALRELQARGIDDDYPHQIGEPNGSVDGTMVFSRLPLGEPVGLEADFQSWQVEVGEGEGAFTLLAVHPRAPVPPGGVAQWSAENATMLAAAEDSDADVVTGDFNATADHAPMRAWRAAGYRDSLELVNAGWSRTWPANGITPVPGLHPPALIQIDHVLVGPTYAVTDSEVVEVDGSDHRAVLATVARR
jgi:endonuclease/exonuclease/phosphatase (EEP) superfamily protein YafD